MGGYGPGSRNRMASQTDEFRKLDLAGFQKHWFENCREGAINWSFGGYETGSINYYLSPKFMHLSYLTGGKHVKEAFLLEKTDQHFGGHRRWIICNSCQRRCRVLYGGQFFRCRKCYELTYPSQYEDIRVPGLSTLTSLKAKLGGEAGFAFPFPDRPKGMHWKTFRRYEEAYVEAEKRMWVVLGSRFL